MIFLSYARADSTCLADRLAQHLETEGFDVWLDRQDIRIGDGWSQVIESAIDRCDQLVALLTPASLVSPICRGEQLRALRKEKPLIPLLVGNHKDRPIYLEGGSYLPFAADPAREDFERLTAALRQGSHRAAITPRYREAAYKTAPNPELLTLKRDEEIAAIRDLLLRENDTRIVAIAGMGGLGKTVVARQLIDDAVIQAAFHDGLLWASFGREVNPALQLEQVQEFAKALNDPLDRYTTLRGSMNQLRTTLHDKAALLILDDVWSRKDIEDFLFPADRCRILLTTRSSDVADAVSASIFPLPHLTRQQSLELMGLKCKRRGSDLPAPAANIADLSDGLPMTLALVGASCRRNPDEQAAWSHWEETLRRGDYSEFEDDNPELRNSRVFDVLEKSWDMLPPAFRERYLDLAVFPKNTSISFGALEALGCAEPSAFVRRWVNLSMTKSGRRNEIHLHSLQADFVRMKRPDCAPLHQKLASALSELLQRDPERFFADSYLPHWYTYHLRAAGRTDAAEDLLGNPEWLRSKLDRGDIASLARDFASARETDTRTIAAALTLSSHVLRNRPGQLPSQLTARLRRDSSARTQAFLERLAATAKDPWLEPLTSSITEPGNPLVRVLTGSTAEIRCAAVTPDGRVVAGCEDGMLRIWSVIDGAPAAPYRAHTHAIESLSISPSGTHCLTLSHEGSIRLWTLAPVHEVARFNLPPGWDCCCVQYLSETLAIVGGDDGCLRLFDLPALTPRQAISTGGHRIRCICSLDNSRVATGGSDDTIRIWSLNTGAFQTLLGHHDTVRSLATAGDALLASGSDDRTVSVWNLNQGARVHTFREPEAEVCAVAADPKGLVFGATADGILHIWDALNGSELQRLRTHRGSNTVHCLAYQPHANLILTGSSDRTIRVWDMQMQASATAGFEHDRSVYSVAISVNGQLAASGGDDARIRIWGLHNGQVEARHTITGHQGEVRGIALSPDGTTLVSGSLDSTVRVWDTESGRLIAQLEGAGRVKTVVFLPDGRSVLAGGTEDVLMLWHLDHPDSPVRFEGHRGDVEAIAVDGAGRLAVSGSVDRTVRFWDIPSQTLRFSGDAHSDVVREIAVSANGRRAISGGGDGQLLVWDVDLQTTCRPLEGHESGITALALTPDGRSAVSGSSDRTIRVWDVDTGHQIADFECEGTVHACAISQDGSMIVAGDELGRVHFLKLRGGRANAAAGR